ncbi:GNAT family N-acetyltransferase, partial [bacterium]|nr:GNAT family N-acetyltransferase [bacterium]
IYKISLEFFKKKFSLISYPKWYFKLFYYSIVKNGYGDFIAVTHKGNIIGTAMFIKYGQNIYYLWSAYKLKFSKFTPTSILIDYIIEKYSGKNIETLDLGHTSPDNIGLLAYKAKFGGINKKLYHFYISKRKLKINKKEPQFHFFRLLINHIPKQILSLLNSIVFKLYIR